MDENIRKSIILDLNLKIGSDINNLVNAADIQNELSMRRTYLLNCLTTKDGQLPTKIQSAITQGEEKIKEIEGFTKRNDILKNKISTFLEKTSPLLNELDNRFKVINKLEDVREYLTSFKKMDDLCNQLKQCNDDEQAVSLYGEMKAMCTIYSQGHIASYVKEYTHYWHNILKDKFAKQYEDQLKLIKWPFTSSEDNAPPTKENLAKFNILTKYLFLIQEPKYEDNLSDGTSEPSLPVKLLLAPIKKRFVFHFMGSRQTARIDRPEWFLTQTLTWIKDHSHFITKNIQPVANKLQMKDVKVVEEFQDGLVLLAAERLHTVLGLYYSQGSQVDNMAMDAAFAHAIDETLGFHKELSALTRQENNSVLSVLTKAEMFVKWIAVEKKYALSKMDESLSSEQWMEAVAAGVASAVGLLLWVPRGADWFITMLKTIEQRYSVLPQPGHRLQFLELQLELIEEWRVRLTQLLSASLNTLTEETLLKADDSPHPLTAVINAANHSRAVLLQWAHSLHYLQLYYYRRQFQHFTQQHHGVDMDMNAFESPTLPPPRQDYFMVEEPDEAVSLVEIESRANQLAIKDITRRNSNQIPQIPIIPPMLSSLESMDYIDIDDSGVFGEAQALLLHIRDAGLRALTDHILLEFKATIKNYKKQKWHAMSVMEDTALSVSPTLCRPLAGLCARLHGAYMKLAPCLGVKLRRNVAIEVDTFLYEEVILENWWNPGGTCQVSHDLNRNFLPVFGASKGDEHYLPKMVEAVSLLEMDFEAARLLQANLMERPDCMQQLLLAALIKNIPADDVIRILNQRTDMCDQSIASIRDLL